MPFITEEIWQALPNDCESIMIAKWPAYRPELDFAADEREFARVMEAIRGIRNVRTEMNVPPSRKAAVYVDTQYEEIFRASAAFFQRLASASELRLTHEPVEGAVQVATQSARIFLPMEELIDKQKELERLNREKAGCEKEIALLSGKLSNEKFVSRAPEAVVNNEREKLRRAQELLQKLTDSIAALG